MEQVPCRDVIIERYEEVREWEGRHQAVTTYHRGFTGGSFGPLQRDIEQGVGAGGMKERSANQGAKEMRSEPL